MRLLVTLVLVAALALAALAALILIVKAAMALALIAALVFAGYWAVNFVRALTCRLAARAAAGAGDSRHRRFLSTRLHS